ncbi:hypothetical protein HA402_007020 [Bradysia odoriphaga]|nr:hypothetical protein HA402_007020 [Bradysia odoriphaga]
MDEVRRLAIEHKPKVIIAGWSAYPRTLDFAAFRAIADEVGALLWVDMAHFAGLVAAGLHPNPVPHAHVVSSTVHKTIGGPRSGFILTNDAEIAKKINTAVFPGQQGGPLMHVIAAKATAFKLAGTPEFKERQERVLRGAKLIAERLSQQDVKDAGVAVRSGGTDVHLVLVDLRDAEIDGKQAEDLLHDIHITVNRNAVPNDPRPPMVTSGLRIGTPALATRGFGDAEFTEVADIIALALLPAVRGRDMTAQILDGKAAAAAIKAELSERVAVLKTKGIVPGIATVLVGADPASQLYVGMKHRQSEAIGMNSIQRELPADATQAEVEALIDELNADPACHGYIVQLPLPKHLDTDAILERIDPAKDADGLHPTNLGRLVLNVNGPIHTSLPCTPRGVIELLLRNDYDLKGKHVVVVGRGVTIGRPMGLLLTRRDVNATVTQVHTGTPDMSPYLREADVIVAGAGVKHLIRAEDVKPGAAVLDVGVTRETDAETGKSRVFGDVHPDVAEVAGWISPNPGGVGPMTVALLMTNVVEAAEQLV